MCHSENEVIPRYANAAPQPELSQTLIELDIMPDAEDNALCPVSFKLLLEIYVWIAHIISHNPDLIILYSGIPVTCLIIKL